MTIGVMMEHTGIEELVMAVPPSGCSCRRSFLSPQLSIVVASCRYMLMPLLTATYSRSAIPRAAGIAGFTLVLRRVGFPTFFFFERGKLVDHG